MTIFLGVLGGVLMLGFLAWRRRVLYSAFRRIERWGEEE